MARPNWNYVRIDVGMPGHPKIAALSPGTKWTLIELWCWCGQYLTDGFVPAANWNRIGTPRERNAIVAAGLAVPEDGGWRMHDYLEHQRSRAEVDEKRAQRVEAGKNSAAARQAKRLRLVGQNGNDSFNDSFNGRFNGRSTEAEAEADTTRA